MVLCKIDKYYNQLAMVEVGSSTVMFTVNFWIQKSPVKEDQNLAQRVFLPTCQALLDT